MPQSKPERHVGLARALSKLGYCSRSQAAELIRAGRVKQNGSVRRSPEAPVLMGRDRIEVDGKLVEATNLIYRIMNKPRGLITTASDEKDRDTIYSLLPDNETWLAPVGRLDKASEGLLLLTNDSEWAARITAPESHLDKTYHVQINALASAELIRSLQRGVRDGSELLRARKVKLLRSGEKNCWLEFVLDEGRNRHIRRMMQAQGIEVLRLIRVAIGALQLGDLAKGAVRELTADEKRALDHALQEFTPRAKKRKPLPA